MFMVIVFLPVHQELSTLKWGSAPWMIPNNGACAILIQKKGISWLQPEHCYAKHQFKCIKKGNLILRDIYLV